MNSNTHLTMIIKIGTKGHFVEQKGEDLYMLHVV